LRYHVLHLSQPNIAQHLAYLRHAGLVSSRRKGYRVYYQFLEKRDRVFSGLLGSLRLAFDRDPVFVGDTRRLKKAIKDGTCVTQSALRGR
jgi:DNA-binding transcriptional ArsR family regulator